MAFCSNGFIVYGLTILNSYPAYQQLDDNKTWVYVSREEICSQNMPENSWKIDYDNDTSLHNWVDKLDLTCTSKNLIGSIGSSYFIGFAISSVVTPIISDRIGRKKPIFISMLL